MTNYTSDFLPRKRKRRRGCLIALLGAVLIIGAALAGVFSLGVLGIRVENNFQLGLKHLNAGESLLKKGIAATGELGNINADSDRHRIIIRDLKLISRADREFKLSEQDFKKMKKAAIFSWERETADLMMKSVGETKAAAAGFRDEIKKVEDIADILNKVGQGAGKFKQAIDKSNKLIVLNNSSRFADVKQAAPQVAALYQEAKQLIATAEKVTSKSGLSSYENRISLGEELVTRLNLMADLGLSQNWPEYNRLKDENNGILSQLVKTSQSAIIANPSIWAESQFNQVFQEIGVHIDKAEKFKIKALDLWAKNT